MTDDELRVKIERVCEKWRPELLRSASSVRDAVLAKGILQDIEDVLRRTRDPVCVCGIEESRHFSEPQHSFVDAAEYYGRWTDDHSTD